MKDDKLPSNTNDIISEHAKLGTYLSFKWETEFNISFDISLYHQSKINEVFYTPRLASSSSVTYNFTEHLGLILQYQNIYDYAPIVPLEKLYNRLTFTIDVSF